MAILVFLFMALPTLRTAWARRSPFWMAVRRELLSSALLASSREAMSLRPERERASVRRIWSIMSRRMRRVAASMAAFLRSWARCWRARVRYRREVARPRERSECLRSRLSWERTAESCELKVEAILLRRREVVAGGALGVLAVTLELGTHSGELRVESGSDLVEATGGGGLVSVDEALELGVVLKVGLVALVAELHHAGHLSVHVGVHLSLGGAVGAHNTGGGVDAGGDLLHLLLHDGGKTEDTDLELLLGGTDTTVGLLAGGGDIGNGLGVPVVLKGTGGVQGSRETCGGVLLGHGHVHTVELGSCGGHKCGDLVVSPGALSLILSTELSAELALRLLGGALEAVHLVVPVTHGLLEVLLGLLGVLLDLCRVGCDVLVHLVDAGVGSGGPRGGGALPSGDGQTKVAGSLAAIALDHGDRLPVTLHGCPPTTVSEASLLGELLLGAAHGSVEVVTASLGVDSHLVEHVPLELGTRGGVESEVTRHLGTHGSDIGTTVGELRCDPPLNTVEVVHQTHAPGWGLGVDLAGLEDICGVDTGAGIMSLNDLLDVLLCPVGGDVHHHQTCHSQSAENSTCNLLSVDFCHRLASSRRRLADLHDYRRPGTWTYS